MKKQVPQRVEFAERRSSIRADRNVSIQHRLVKRASKKTETFWDRSLTKNMSLTGLLFSSNKPYKLGDVVELTVTMTELFDLFKGFGKVVRVIERKDKSFDIALHFIELKPRSRSAKSHL